MGIIIDKIFIHYIKKKKQTIFNRGLFSYDPFKEKNDEMYNQELQLFDEEMRKHRSKHQEEKDDKSESKDDQENNRSKIS